MDEMGGEETELYQWSINSYTLCTCRKSLTKYNCFVNWIRVQGNPPLKIVSKANVRGAKGGETLYFTHFVIYLSYLESFLARHEAPTITQALRRARTHLFSTRTKGKREEMQAEWRSGPCLPVPGWCARTVCLIGCSTDCTSGSWDKLYPVC